MVRTLCEHVCYLSSPPAPNTHTHTCTQASVRRALRLRDNPDSAKGGWMPAEDVGRGRLATS